MPSLPDPLDPTNTAASPIVRLAEPSDVPGIRQFLEAYRETSLFLLSNLDEVGIRVTSAPTTGNFGLIEEAGRLVGVFCLTRKGDLLAQTGADVVAVDKAPLDPSVDALANVHWRGGSAFALDPRNEPPVDWLCSDIVCYPSRLLALVQRWVEADTARTMICTIKFQGATDHGIVREFAAIPGATVSHLHHNKHELTWCRL